MNRAVFLDRDGVINRPIRRDGKSRPPSTLAELEILPGVPEALHALRENGFLLIVVTNQPDVARGKLERARVEEINAALARRLPLHDILVCYHDDVDDCRCRKPRPGLLLEAAQKYAIDLRSSFMIGDRAKDIEAGRRAGCRTCLVDPSDGLAAECSPDHVADSLLQAVDWFLDFQPSIE